MKKLLKITRDDLTFNVRIIERGDLYGRNMDLTYDSDTPVVEFYDFSSKKQKEAFSPYGQFISRYRIDSILEHGDLLYLEKDIENWRIYPQNMRKVKEFLKDFKEERGMD